MGKALIWDGEPEKDHKPVTRQDRIKWIGRSKNVTEPEEGNLREEEGKMWVDSNGQRGLAQEKTICVAFKGL